ncbi:UNVERIFIED_CONTAM: hypothetical protein FKN15_017969 [Acipenser sinensis]
MGRRNFAKDIIFEFLGDTAPQIYCYRDFPLRSTYDVTFMVDYLCQEAWNKCLDSKDVSPISNFRVEPLFSSRGALPVAAAVAAVEEPLAFGLEPPTVEGPVAGVSGAGKDKRNKKEKSVTSVKNLPEAMVTEESTQGTVILDTPVGGGKQWGDTEESGEMGWEVTEGKRTTKRKLNQEESGGDNKVCVIVWGRKEKRKKKEKSVFKKIPDAMATEKSSQGTVILDTPVGGGKQ